MQNLWTEFRLKEGNVYERWKIEAKICTYYGVRKGEKKIIELFGGGFLSVSIPAPMPGATRFDQIKVCKTWLNQE